MAKVTRKFPTAPKTDGALEVRLRAIMNKTFSNADKSNLDNALHLAGSKKLGKPASIEAIQSLAKRTQEPNIAIRLLMAEYQTQDKSSVEQLLRAVFGMINITTKNAALDSTGEIQPNIVLAAFFVNRIINDPEGTVRKLADLSVDPVKKIVRLYLSWWSTLDLAEIRQHLAPKSNSSGGRRITFCMDPSVRGKPVSEQTTFLVKLNGAECGTLNWDNTLGEPTSSGHGWVATLYDGFIESKYRTGKNPQNPNEPFTCIHSNELKLQNPTRMNIKYAKQWAREALKL